MKNGNWIPLDKMLIKYLPKDRPFTVLEAYFSLRYDVAEKKNNTINGYAQLWQWDRKKVRGFVQGMMSGKAVKLGHLKDTKGPGKGTLIPHDICFIFDNLESQKDINSPLSPHFLPTFSPTTINTNKKKIYKEKVLLTDKEYVKLKNQFGEKGTESRIENLNNYLCSKGKKYASHYHTILAWERKNNPEPNLLNPLCTTPAAY